MICVRRTLLDRENCLRAVDLIGAIYFLKDGKADCVKIGHSMDPGLRKHQLQVGNVNDLVLIGAVAAERSMESYVHGLCEPGYVRGEWFMDRGVLSEWLREATDGQPLYGSIWDLTDVDFLGDHSRHNLVRVAA